MGGSGPLSYAEVGSRFHHGRGRGTRHDRVTVRGATGRAAPACTSNRWAYRPAIRRADNSWYMARGLLWPRLNSRREIYFERLERAGVSMTPRHVERLGTGRHGCTVRQKPPKRFARVVLRQSVREEAARGGRAVQRGVRPVRPPAGTAEAWLGYTAGVLWARSSRPSSPYWPDSGPLATASKPNVE